MTNNDTTAAQMHASRLKQVLDSKSANKSWIVLLSISFEILALLSAAVAITVAVIQVSSVREELTAIREQSVTG